MSDPAEFKKQLYEAVLTGNNRKAEEVTKQALEAGVNASEMVKEGVIPAMEEVGKRFECNEYFVPELLIAQRAMKTAVGLLGTGGEAVGRVVIGTVRGDLHDIGKNLVAAMLQGCGFEVIDLKVDVPAEKFVQTAKEKDAHIVAMSALLTTTMTQMQKVVEALNEAGLRDKVKVMIGGAPITQDYADRIGADGYSDNASAAVNVARKLVA
jgi:5-methyltetrahydrofolate--homocysteine methyltransferase